MQTLAQGQKDLDKICEEIDQICKDKIIHEQANQQFFLVSSELHSFHLIDILVSLLCLLNLFSLVLLDFINGLVEKVFWVVDGAGIFCCLAELVITR